MAHKKQSQLRIIGGEWRGRRLPIADMPGLRPTPDRVRETLFNWLAPRIIGARCLDAFAGTGALGLEALSRGAAEVLFIEKNRQLAQEIQTQLQTLGSNGQVVCGEYTRTPMDAKPFDIVFLDPHFNTGLLEPALAHTRKHLALGGRVYMEYAHNNAPQLAADWKILKSRQAGQVGYALATMANASEDKPT